MGYNPFDFIGKDKRKRVGSKAMGVAQDVVTEHKLREKIKEIIDDICLNFQDTITMKDMGKIMSNFNVEYNGKADNNMVASEYGVRSIPTLLIFKDGSVVNQIVGAVPKEKITDILDTVI